MLKRKVTISDVAKFAKVGKTSVSRYLNSEFDILSNDIKEKISNAIDILGYQPSQIARSMKRGKTKLIALIFTDIKNPYSIDVMLNVEVACRNLGYTLIVFNTNYEMDQEANIIKSLLSYQVEGIIIQAVDKQDNNFNNISYPIVSIDRSIDGIESDVISLDNFHATDLIVEHLVKQNFDDIIFITDTVKGIQPREERLSAFQHCISKYNNISYEILESERLISIDEGISQFYMRNPHKKKAIVSVNGITTLCICHALKRLNLDIGKHIGLIGFDDASWASIIGNGITTLKQPTLDIGESAVSSLLKRIEGDDSPYMTILHKGELIVRGSTTF